MFAQETNLGEIIKATGGSVRTGPFGTALAASEYTPDGAPVISVGEVRVGSFRITEETRRVPTSVTRRMPEYLLKAGDIVFGRKGAVDRSALVRESEEGYFLGSDGIRLRLGTGIDAAYVAYWLQTARARGWLIRQSVGTTMLTLTQPVLESLPVRLPDIKMQGAVARLLQEADQLIEAYERAISKKLAIKQGTMQELLVGRSRLPGFAGEWATRRVATFGTFLRGRGIKRDDVRTSGIPCIRYGELYTTYADYTATTVSFVEPSVAATALPIRSGDILFAGSGETKTEIGTSMAFMGDVPTVAGGDIIVLRGSDYDPVYMASLLNTPEFANQKAGGGQGDAVVHINWRVLAGLEVTVPPLSEQYAIAKVLRDADSEIAALTNRLEATRAIKQGMMQELLTGRGRLVPKELVA
ncbi:restriction endonuclease subunit S [Cryobacterium sp. TMT1-66-1]|uniref:restriction endonuclease subunit S n=1 Tax=Cryobacterium sp. TMT1-66-1 TaxID=1259242 RepID=UPI00106A78BF|nr:restriction endonuclease subunit S [Cryobacterium sp. TMT1-66-1]TFD07541.1 restriction endonuclease subunit S [Cryobacterium sp. TMT1-66-1]